MPTNYSDPLRVEYITVPELVEIIMNDVKNRKPKSWLISQLGKRDDIEPSIANAAINDAVQRGDLIEEVTRSD